MSSEIRGRLIRSAIIGLVAAVLTALWARQRPQPSDLAQLWTAARALVHHANPYDVVGPDRAFRWPFPLFYPLTAVVAVIPFSVLPLSVADPAWVGLGAFALAWALTRRRVDNPQLLVFGSLAFGLVIMTSQWAPLLWAAALVPGLEWLLACKPTLGAAFVAAYPSRRTVLSGLAFVVITLLIRPSWPREWLATLDAASHVVAPVRRPGGFIILLALVRWRRPEARLVTAWSCLPQTPQLYEAVPLFTVAQTLPEAIALVILTFAAGLAIVQSVPFSSYAEMMDANGRWMVWLLYLPCTVLVLCRPNVSPHDNGRT